MKTIAVGDILMSIDECAMTDGSGPALLIGKEYEVLSVSSKYEEFAIRSESFERHFFSTNSQNRAFWMKYFLLKRTQVNNDQ
jgi:hypothetical protein